MTLMEDKDPEVKKQALTAVQKLMVNCVESPNNPFSGPQLGVSDVMPDDFMLEQVQNKPLQYIELQNVYCYKRRSIYDQLTSRKRTCLFRSSGGIEFSHCREVVSEL